MPFPSVYNSFNRPTASDRLNNPGHSALHNTVSSALGQVEAVIGLSTSSAVGTLMYDVRSPDSNGGGHVQTANKGGTGQTSYTKGDILVASSSSVLTKLAVGSNDQVLVADSAVATGVKWAAVPAIVVSSTIAVSSVWTKPAAATATSRVFVELWGGGGSGAIGQGTSEAGGGGGGGYASGWYSASILSSVLINVGQGGDSQSGDGNGLPGGITVWNPQTSLLTAYAGGGGQSANGTAYGGGGGGIYASGQNGSSGNGRGGNIWGGSGGLGDGTFRIILDAGTGSITTLGPTQMGGGGGTGNNTGIPSTIGQSAIYGGGGGGGIFSSIASGSVSGGLSTFAGRGGNSSILTTTSAMAGSIPGGGGGAAYGSGGSSGQGGHGMARITTFL